jgi:hypothetical protein
MEVCPSVSCGWAYYQQEKQCTYERNIELPSWNHRCRRKAISVTRSEFLPVMLVIQQEMRVRRIVICGMPGRTMSFHNIS